MSGFTMGTNQTISNLKRLTRTMDMLTHRLSTGRKINAPKDDPSAWASAKKSLSAFNHLESINSSLDMIAMNVRIADITMETIGSYLIDMKSKLEMIKNNDPPLPLTSQERVGMIRDFNNLRNLIDQMTIPPEEGAKKILSDPSVVPVAGDWEILVGENNARITIHSRQVHTGATGLNIPQLSESATDLEIEAAINNLQTAKDTLEQRRVGLAMDMNSITRWQEHNKKMITFHRDRTEKLQNADLNELSAQILSVELKHDLSIEVLRGITENQSQLTKLL